MSAILDPETIYVDNLPTVWSPVQWQLSEDERLIELEEQATASLLWAADAPEAVLRLLLGETDIVRAYEAPPRYDPEVQGEWDEDLLTFQFRRPVELVKAERQRGRLYLEYKFSELGCWSIEILPESIHIQRL